MSTVYKRNALNIIQSLIYAFDIVDLNEWPKIEERVIDKYEIIHFFNNKIEQHGTDWINLLSCLVRNQFCKNIAQIIGEFYQSPYDLKIMPLYPEPDKSILEEIKMGMYYSHLEELSEPDAQGCRTYLGTSKKAFIDIATGVDYIHMYTALESFYLCEIIHDFPNCIFIHDDTEWNSPFHSFWGQLNIKYNNE
eukprot:164598_1